MAKRILTIETDGASIDVTVCELTPLELNSALGVLLEGVRRGQFPYPSGKAPELMLSPEETPDDPQ